MSFTGARRRPNNRPRRQGSPRGRAQAEQPFAHAPEQDRFYLEPELRGSFLRKKADYPYAFLWTQRTGMVDLGAFPEHEN